MSSSTRGYRRFAVVVLAEDGRTVHQCLISARKKVLDLSKGPPRIQFAIADGTGKTPLEALSYLDKKLAADNNGAWFYRHAHNQTADKTLLPFEDGAQ